MTFSRASAARAVEAAFTNDTYRYAAFFVEGTVAPVLVIDAGAGNTLDVEVDDEVLTFTNNGAALTGQPVVTNQAVNEVYGATGTTAPTSRASANTTLVATINAVTSGLAGLLEERRNHVFQFSLLNADVPNLTTTSGGLGSSENSNFYWIGRLEALLVNPALTDANQATLTLSIQSDFIGPETF